MSTHARLAAMSAKFRPAAAVGQSLAQLIATIGGGNPPLWTRVEAIEVNRAKRGQGWENLGSFAIVHVEGQDDCEPDIDAAIAYCKDDARNLGAGHRYQLIFRGVIPGKGKKPEEHNAPLYTWTERFGDPELSDDGSLLGQATSFLRAVPGIYEGATTTSAKVLELTSTSQTMLLNQLASVMLDNERLRARQHEANEWIFKTKELELGALREERQERREDTNQRMAEEHETRRAAQTQAHHRHMIAEAKDFFSMFVGMYQVSKGYTPPQPPPPPGVPPSDGSIVGDLRVLLTNITAEEKAEMRERAGHDLWNMLLQASRASDDDGARAVLGGITRYVKQNPGLANNLFAAGQVIAGPRFTALMDILKRGGAVPT